MDINDIPEFIVNNNPGKKRANLVYDRHTSELKKFGHRLSDLVERAPHTTESLAVFLSNRVYAGKQAQKRAKHWWGRFYNMGIGEKPPYIKLNGLNLIQTLDVVDKLPDDMDIPIKADCSIRLDIADKALQILRKQLAENQSA